MIDKQQLRMEAFGKFCKARAIGVDTSLCVLDAIDYVLERVAEPVAPAEPEQPCSHRWGYKADVVGAVCDWCGVLRKDEPWRRDQFEPWSEAKEAEMLNRASERLATPQTEAEQQRNLAAAMQEPLPSESPDTEKTLVEKMCQAYGNHALGCDVDGMTAALKVAREAHAQKFLGPLTDEERIKYSRQPGSFYYQIDVDDLLAARRRRVLATPVPDARHKIIADIILHKITSDGAVAVSAANEIIAALDAQAGRQA